MMDGQGSQLGFDIFVCHKISVVISGYEENGLYNK
jgi:hypothetical protein